MFNFLNSLFSTDNQRPTGVDDDLIDAAMDRVIEGTDTRLQALVGYRRQLRESVEQAVVHVINLVDSLPEPVEISHRSFSDDPRLKAFFASIEHMQETIGRAKTVETYLKQTPVAGNGRLYGLLTMQWEEKNRLGMVIQDDRIQRDVQQVVINFLNHNFIGPAVSPDEATLNVTKRAFDFMVETALERIIAERTRYDELEQQRRLLTRKLKAMKAGNWGLEDMLRPEAAGVADYSRLETEINGVERELVEMAAPHEVLDKNLDIIKDTLSSPEKLLALRNIELELDSMNIKADSSTAAKVHKLCLIEAYSGIGANRIIMPGWFPVNELPGSREPIADAMRYL